MGRRPTASAAGLRLAAAMLLAAPFASMGAGCEASAGAQPPAIVELYTSQGCSSCPPADRWLSTLKGHTGVIALGFHVNYWNHLGWKDPFASAQTTQRQHRIREAARAPYGYTPQVVLNGVDHRGWRGQRAQDLPPLPAHAAPSLRLVREEQRVVAQIGAGDGQHRWAGYWAVLQDDQRSAVTRGENAGEILRNDHVVRQYVPVAPWPARQSTMQVLPLAAAAGQRVVFVVTQADGLRPVQAVALRCSH